MVGSDKNFTSGAPKDKFKGKWKVPRTTTLKVVELVEDGYLPPMHIAHTHAPMEGSCLIPRPNLARKERVFCLLSLSGFRVSNPPIL